MIGFARTAATVEGAIDGGSTSLVELWGRGSVSAMRWGFGGHVELETGDR